MSAKFTSWYARGVILAAMVLLVYGVVSFMRMVLVSPNRVIEVLEIQGMYAVEQREFYQKHGISRIEFMERDYRETRENRERLNRIVETLHEHGIEVPKPDPSPSPIIITYPPRRK